MKGALLVGSLFRGAIDIVGDIHGETGALYSLLDRLGYDSTGVNPDGRRLVFVGDILDRGPDSPGAFRFVKSLVENRSAQMVLGNHEVNLLRGARTRGNLWFWGETEPLCTASSNASHPVLMPTRPSFQSLVNSDAERDDILDFLRKQPLVLEREGLRVVHAMWHESGVNHLRAFDGDVAQADVYFRRLTTAKLEAAKLQREMTDDESEMMIQNENPVNLAVTGMEVPAVEPFFAGGKLRTLQRYPWWTNYTGEAGLVVVGHYWRRLLATVDLGFSPTGPSIFSSDEQTDEPVALGPSHAVACIDFSVGMRFEERCRGLREGSLGTALAALRLPEMQLHFADGRPPVRLQGLASPPQTCS
eukprot:TRINITY_DN37983_c0_g1_i1.p1 TRINITY_DN37983_c0_g1~~TRINITY_DN37983_c0_g1_i1.p1  ORF type:complete len:360 (-),score=44.96 TRINITY_DN37983_c0_g1_i1:259-1338(-)